MAGETKAISELTPAGIASDDDLLPVVQGGATRKQTFSGILKYLQANSPANVTAFGDLTGAADRLPYFTGVGALSLTTLTAFARTLLDDANQAAMQTTLGIGSAGLAALTTSNNDTTSGRVLKVGDFGLGAQSVLVTDANAISATGSYRIGSAGLNIPTANSGELFHNQATAAISATIFIETGSGRFWWRTQTGASTYTPWLESQPLAAALAALAALTPAANTFPYWTSTTAAANATLSTGGRALLGLTYATDRIGYTTSASAAAVTPLTAFGRSLIDDADAATARATLGVLAQGDKPAWTGYTPTITPTAGSYTSAGVAARYLVLYGICFVQIVLTVTTKGTGTFPTLTLPFPALSGSANHLLQCRESNVNKKMGQAVINTALTGVLVSAYDNTELISADGCNVLISGSYPIA